MRRSQDSPENCRCPLMVSTWRCRGRRVVRTALGVHQKGSWCGGAAATKIQVAKAVVAVVCEATSTYARRYLLWSFVNTSIKFPQTSLILSFRGSICEPRVIRHGTAASSSEARGWLRSVLAGPGLAGRSGQVGVSVVPGRDKATTGGGSRAARCGFEAPGLDVVAQPVAHLWFGLGWLSNVIAKKMKFGVFKELKMVEYLLRRGSFG